MNLRQLAREGEEQLKKAGVPEARREARWLLLDSFHITSSAYLLYAEKELEEVFPALGKGIAMPLGHYRERIQMRVERKPLQQILGETTFMGLIFRVSEQVLCPRQDTEVLVEKLLSDYEGKDPKILDLCCGSGCIGVSLQVLGKFSDVTLSDLSEKALELARFNAEKLSEQKIRLFQGDLFQAIPEGEHFDVIVSNPPYIREDVIETLEPEVKCFEPRMALSGGKDGLSFYRRIIEKAPLYAPALYLEIGFDQASEVKKLLEQAGYTDIEILKDYGGHDRVIKGRQHSDTLELRRA